MSSPRVRRFLRAAAFALAPFLLLACERAAVDPSVVDRPLPAADGPVDSSLAATGAVLYQRKCVACHAWTETIVGPPMAGVTARRSPAWIRGMVLRPDSMLTYDDTARSLLAAYEVPMADLQLEERQFRAIWEYVRARDTGTLP